MAIRTQSTPSTTEPSAQVTVFDPAVSAMDLTPPVFLSMDIPCLSISLSRVSLMRSSNSRSALSFLSTRVTSEPRVFRTPASSTAMYPAPTTTAFLGRSGRSKKPSEEIAFSEMPSPGGKMG